MSKSSIIITAGILVIVLPFLGFPAGWKTFLFVVIGLIICLSELYGMFSQMYRENFLNEHTEVVNDVFTERRVNGKENKENYQQEDSTDSI